MNIKMKKTYAGPLGLFAKDLTYDLPGSVVKQLDKDSYIDVPSFFDAHKAAAKSPDNKQSRPGKGKVKTK